MKKEIVFQMNLHFVPQVLLANEVKISAPNQHFRRRPTEYILYFIRDGEMLLREGEEVYHLGKGDVILLDPSRWHTGIKSNHAVYYFYAHFRMENMHEYNMSAEEYRIKNIQEQYEMDTYKANEKSSFLWLPKYCHLDKENRQRMYMMAREMQLHFHGESRYCEEQAGCRLLLFFMELHTIQMKRFLKEADDTTQATAQIIAFLKQHYQEKIDSHDIEESLHMNFDYLNRQFKRNTGSTIFQYLNAYRVEESKKLLKSGLYSQEEISAMTGFCNAFYFSKVFKKYTSITPTAYKKML